MYAYLHCEIIVKVRFEYLCFILVNVEKMRAKQELEIMESRYSLDLITYRTKLEELNKEIEQFKAEVNFIFYT